MFDSAAPAPIHSELNDVAADLLARDPDGSRWASVIRHTYDMIYNGQETGRYRWDQLMKTERTHFGTLFEINAQREFQFEGGDATDYRVAGHQVDAKWSQSMGGWMLPPEVFEELALVATGDDAASRWSLELVRVREEYRREGGNRDKKSQLNAVCRGAIRWLWREAPLPPNVLLQLPSPTVDGIFAHSAGTQRTDRLFREQRTTGRYIGNRAGAVRPGPSPLLHRARRRSERVTAHLTRKSVVSAALSITL